MFGKSLRWLEAYVGFSVDVFCKFTIALLVWLWLLSILFSFCWHFEKTTPKCCISSFSSNFRETETATSFHVLVRYDFFLQIKKIAVPSREIRDWMELDLIISWHHWCFRCTGWFVALGRAHVHQRSTFSRAVHCKRSVESVDVDWKKNNNQYLGSTCMKFAGADFDKNTGLEM